MTTLSTRSRRPSDTALTLLPGGRSNRKRERLIYVVKADATWLHDLTLSSYVAKGAPTWWRFFTKWLWTPPYSELSPAELGALVKIIGMFMRDRDAYSIGVFETHRKELRIHGLTDALIRKVSRKLGKLEISVLTEDGEIREL